MFSIFKSDEKAKLQKAYKIKMEAAMQAQRSGDIQKFAEISTEAEEIAKKIDQVKDKE